MTFPFHFISFPPPFSIPPLRNPNLAEFMASSAFKSTTRRTLHPAADDRPPARPRKAPPPCPRRSRSASVEPRARGIGEYAAGNTRTNPLRRLRLSAAAAAAGGYGGCWVSRRGGETGEGEGGGAEWFVRRRLREGALCVPRAAGPGRRLVAVVGEW